MKNKLRTVNVIGTDWSYVIGKSKSMKGEVSTDEVRIYVPNTKQILVRVDSSILKDDDGSIKPSAVKHFIKHRIMGL